jgi:hypothetical protein
MHITYILQLPIVKVMLSTFLSLKFLQIIVTDLVPTSQKTVYHNS